jgi:hypothetical protein
VAARSIKKSDLKKVEARSLRRPRSFRKERPCVLIVCEGKKTEPNYFEGLKKELKLPIDIQIEHENPAPISVVDYAIRLKTERAKEAKYSSIKSEYDIVWCVVDAEIKKHESLDRAYDKAKANQLHFIITNPFFEYWYLLHFERTSQLFQTKKQLLNCLKKHINGYKKNDPKVFNILWPKTNDALDNANGVIAEKGYGDDLRDQIPSTHVHKIVEYLLDAKGSN